MSTITLFSCYKIPQKNERILMRTRNDEKNLVMTWKEMIFELFMSNRLFSGKNEEKKLCSPALYSPGINIRWKRISCRWRSSPADHSYVYGIQFFRRSVPLMNFYRFNTIKWPVKVECCQLRRITTLLCRCHCDFSQHTCCGEKSSEVRCGVIQRCEECEKYVTGYFHAFIL